MSHFNVVRPIFNATSGLQCHGVRCHYPLRSVADPQADGPRRDAAPRGVAVVELFTSEGCSSCPPADQLLGEMVELSDQRGFPIICIGWHIDYWDKLGWDDRFSSEAISNRQRAYAKALHSNRIYTPQMIVNGTDEFLGSDRMRAARSVTAAFKERSKARIALNVTMQEPSSLNVAYQVTGGQRSQFLTVVLVEKRASTDVERGENSGKTLQHVNAARSFLAVELSPSGDGEVTLPVPEGLSPDAAQVVAFVQEMRTKKVLGAATAEVPPTEDPQGEIAQ